MSGSRPKKRKNVDGAYHPRRDPSKKRKTNPNKENTNLNKAAMRSQTQQTITSPTGETITVKTSCVIEEKMVDGSPDSKAVFQKKFIESNNNNIPTHRNITITERSKNGSPTKVKTVTPSKTEMTCSSKIGGMRFFSNIPANNPISPIKKLPLKFSIEKDETSQDIKQCTVTEKTQEITIKLDELKKTLKEIKDNCGTRICSQNSVMVKEGVNAKKGSATKYAQTTLFEKNYNWEWLHLVAYSILGSDSQDEKNLVCGTDHSNTEMMAIEQEIKFLAQQYSDGFKLQIKANLIQNTHIAT
ncbi:MAG: hypothetical protein KIT56_11545, partial [Gammaproteobacteria bacterium]|nr:hypothetical protein [Gammaproteobacteria bacterium]